MHTVLSAADAVRRGETTSLDLVDASLDAIQRLNDATHAFIRVDADDARSAARRADDERRRGVDRGPLHGIPISLKDLIDVAGQTTTAGSRVLRDHVAAADAPIVTRLREAGAIFLGKTNLHEFALGTTSEDTAFGAVKNPLDHTRSAGGSSGGSAVAVATGMGLASIGTDTGGSIRIPAAACGIVGLKPSIGEVPTAGVFPLSSSLDHVGPLTRSVDDAACLWQILIGTPFQKIEARDLQTVRASRLGGYFDAITPEVREAFEAALERLARVGVDMKMDTIEGTETITTTYVNIVLPEGALVHAPYLTDRAQDYTPAVRTRFESGRDIKAIDYVAARQSQAGLRDNVNAALARADVLVLPTLPIVAPVLGAADVTIDAERGVSLPVRGAMLRQTQLFNLTGHPAISLPIASRGLPVGLQLVGRAGDTAGLLAIARSCERIVGEA